MAHLADQITLEHHLRLEQDRGIELPHGWFPSLAPIIDVMARASKVIAYGLSGAEVTGMIGAAGHDNKSGDHVQMLDMFAEDTIEKFASASGRICCMASEEREEIIPVSKDGLFHHNGYHHGNYVLAFDPLDGSSNINANITVGTIWSLRQRTGTDNMSIDNFTHNGRTLLAAGYTVYGARTQFVYASWNGVHIFTLDPISGDFILTKRDVKMPTRGRVYSTNEGNTNAWSEGVKKYVQHLKNTDSVGRCSGAMIADFHRILLGGGIFFYPNPKLRLLYEAAPVAFIADKAGGRTIDGVRDILDITPTSIHQKVPLIFGSADNIQEYMEIVNVDPF